MPYYIQDIQEKFSIVAEDIHEQLNSKNIKVKDDGSISKNSYQILIDFFSKDSNKPVYVLNGHKIKVKTKPFFESDNQRISIFQDDAINFLKGLPSSSVDVIITDPAYSGMNQKLKLGSGKIIGEYKKAGEDGAKWFEEFHDTEKNYKAFLKECLRVLKK